MATKWLRNSKGQLRYFSSQRESWRAAGSPTPRDRCAIFPKSRHYGRRMAHGFQKQHPLFLSPKRRDGYRMVFLQRKQLLFQIQRRHVPEHHCDHRRQNLSFDSNGIARESQDKWDKLLAQYRNDASTNQLVFVQHLGGSGLRS